MSGSRIVLLSLGLLLTAISPLLAQRLPQLPEACRSKSDARLAFYATGAYDPAIPRPEQVFGYPIGSWHTTYGRMEQYLQALQHAASNRVKVIDYGQSVERHTQHLVIISSEAHIQRG